MNFKRVIVGIVFFLSSFVLSVKAANACITYDFHGPVTSWPSKTCSNHTSDISGNTFSDGIEVYSCGNYAQLGGAYGCYWHRFSCDTPCGGGGGGGSNTGCPAGMTGQDFYDCMPIAYGGCVSGYSHCSGDKNCAKCKAWKDETCKNHKCACSTTAATNIVGVRTSGTEGQLDWTAGSYYATYIRLYVGANQAVVNGGCVSAGCVVKELTLDKGTSHFVMHNLDPATSKYYVRIDVYTGNTCNKTSYGSFEGIVCADVTPPTALKVNPGVGSGNATVSWAVGTGGTSQYIYVGEDQTMVENDCVGAGTACIVNTSILATDISYPLTGLTPNKTYYVRVKTYSGTGATCQEGVNGSYSPSTGTIYVITDPTACSDTTSPYSAGGLTVTFEGTSYTSQVGADGTFAILASDGTSHNLSLNGVPAGYVCSTACNPLGCGLTNINPGQDGNNFYLTQAREAWWQVAGGSVYAGSTALGVNIRSLVPPSNELIIPGSLGSVGLLMRAAGTASYDSIGGGLSSTDWSALSKYSGKRMDYPFFKAREGLTTAKTSDWGGSDSLTQQTADSRDFWYMKPPSGSATIDAAWNVLSGEKYVVFVDGNLNINQPVTVANGGFISFIVSGNINVEQSVGSIQGLFITDGIFSSGTNGTATDTQLEVQGSMVAWGGVNLERDMGSANTTDPGELFSYRPDLIVNMPDKMRTYALEWQEVAPGTFNSHISN